MQSDLREVRGGSCNQTIPKDQTEATMASIGEGSETGNFRNVIRIDEGEIRNHLDGLAKTSVEKYIFVR